MLHARVAYIIHVYITHRSLYIASYLYHNARVGVSKKPPQGNALSGAFEGRVYRCTLARAQRGFHVNCGFLSKLDLIRHC